MFLLCQIKAVTEWFSFPQTFKDLCLKAFICTLRNSSVVSGVETIHVTAVAKTVPTLKAHRKKRMCSDQGGKLTPASSQIMLVSFSRVVLNSPGSSGRKPAIVWSFFSTPEIIPGSGRCGGQI